MKREINTRFYTFIQNNSGGYFIKDDNFAEVVNIEEISMVSAWDKLIKKLGANEHCSCSCCGERWSYPWEDEDEFPYEPKINELSAEDYIKKQKISNYFIYDCVIHYYDGTKEKIEGPKRDE